MRLEVQGGRVKVTLSERNLRTLLTKLAGHPAHSACTLRYDTRDGLELIVAAEPDDVHYADRERDTPTPGEMHPETEEHLSEPGK